MKLLRAGLLALAGLVAGGVAACAAPVSDLAAGAAVSPMPAPAHSLAPAAAIAPAVVEAREAIAAALPPAPAPLVGEGEPVVPVVRTVVDLREAVQSALPEPVLEAAERQAPPHNAQAAALIIRWEIGSPKRYAQRYERPVWPGGHSGVTWGVGYDGGQATRHEIARDWADHPQAEQLVRSAGVSGAPAADLTRQLQHVVTPYALAERVFVTTSLPHYSRATRRAYGPALEAVSLSCQAGLEDLTYNRGGGMASDRNREKREIRDRCLPAGDCQCVAAQLRAMKRLWPDVRGLRDRRDDEARTVLN